MRKRFAVFDRQDNPLFDLSVDAMDGEGAVRYERLKGEHKLDITTTQTLQEGLRILSKDGTGKWREWVIDEPAQAHEDGYLATYGCTWSMQYDLATVSGGELWPGTYEPITASAALAMVLATQARWEVGNVTVSGTAGTSLYDGQVWDYLGTLQEVWGGEMEPRIVVDASGVVHRYVDWLAHVGSTTASRRFDYGEDCTAIRQKVDPGPRYCWVEPRGGRDATDNDGISYSERVGVEEEPADIGDGWAHDADSKYVRDPDAEIDFRQPDGNGGWHYPTKVVIYDSDDPEELLEMAVSDLHEHTRPKTTYEADVLQFAAAGMDPHGVALGDEVQIVDKTFGDAPLRLQARIVEITVNELDETDVQLVIGEANKGIESAFKSMRSAIDAAVERSRRIEGAGTIVYLQHLLDGLNAEINGTGGYSYFVGGEGIVTYDVAVADPMVATEASKVVQVKGGSIRFAKEKNAQFAGIADWKWTNVITSDGYLGLAATIAKITTGWLGNANGTYIDLDNNTANFGPTSGYHFTVDTNGVRYYYGSTLLGQYLSTSMQLGKSSAAHISVGTSGVELFDASAVSEMLLSTSSTRFGRSDKAHITVTPSSGIAMYDANNTSIASLTGSSLRVGATSTARVTITPSSGIEMYDGNNSSMFSATYSSNVTTVRIGKTSGTGRIDISSDGYVDLKYGSTMLAHFGYGSGKNSSGGTSDAPYYDIGVRKSGSSRGNYSVAEGYNCTASGYCSHAEGCDCSATASYAHAEGYNCTASGYYSHAGGYSCTATDQAFAHGASCHAYGDCSVAFGFYTRAYGKAFVCGSRNVGYGNVLMEVGRDLSYNANAMYLDTDGDMWIAGSLSQDSDRRLKTHHAYLGDDAVGFIRQLRPALYTKDGERHVGFYAQNVQEAEPDEWDTVTVTAKHTNEGLDFDPLTLDYDALIAPLVAYAQHLERRIEQQQETIDMLVARIERLEARL